MEARLDAAIVGGVAAYDDAVTALYRAPFADFVAERKRLAAELKATGDKDGSARLAKLARPPVSAWAVNQLWWEARDDFEQLIAVAARVKSGDRDASKAHRTQLTKLRDQAAELLRGAGNAAAEATLRRVTTTLSAIAAQGDFGPDAPGALSADRDPPGFEALGFAGAPARVSPPPAAEKSPSAAEARHAEAEQRRLEAERRRAEEEERKRRLAERERLSGAIRDARAQEKSQQREQSRLQRELEDAEQSLKETQALLERLEQELASL
ncbi:MAG: hypothetical protein EOO73_10560 [Myxococcales bacterium]|nr:MAG: hypothetical protein EOO73_10560 [Myxococcales bacterium]